MNQLDVVKCLLGERYMQAAHQTHAQAFAPTNIALCKYWGKRNQIINLPMTSSLSIALGDKGADIAINLQAQDEIYLNGLPLSLTDKFSQRLLRFVNLFRSPTEFFKIQIHSNIPIAAGLASSACGFASVIKALDRLYEWELAEKDLSILARLGSGSAARSLWQGFVEWEGGHDTDGMDSFAMPLPNVWPELNIGLLIFSTAEKKHPSTDAMQRTVETSALYSAWPKKVADDLIKLKTAIKTKDFVLLGETAESNALSMHATMLSAVPAICYWLPETLLTMEKIWKLRAEGLNVYFTQDAGPNLKLLFQKKDVATLLQYFPEVHIVEPFDSMQTG